MKKVFLVATRELAGYLNGYLGYLLIAVLLFLAGLVFFALLSLGAMRSTTALSLFFQIGAFVTASAAILLAMRTFAEERQTRTELVWLTAPLRDAQVVLGKWLAVFAMITLFLVGTLHIPAILFVHGRVSVAHVAVGYVGLACYGGAAAAVGVFASSLVRSQVAAALLGLGIMVPLISLWRASELVEYPLNHITAYLDFYGRHFLPFASGVLATNHLVYYASVTAVFLTLATQVLAQRRVQ